MKQLKKIGVLSAAKIEGLMCALMGLVIAIIFLLIGGVVSAITGMRGEEFGMLGGGIFMLIALPVFYGIMGFIAGAIGSYFYNLIAEKFGGLEIEISDIAVKPAVKK